MNMITKIITKLLAQVRKPKHSSTAIKEHPQVALPLRADLPLRERSRALVAVPAQINGVCMGSDKF
ncbi:hypothetical protein SAMN05880561_101608 [Rhizobium sp. RU33A]|uniref:hypothetical protein n=1 Tax=Rhizobium sp. RU33A TaxID=1907413 RepID=UPI0009540DC4|nr:hypothetical protein [Rhizobium sp. RU33A]SIP98622.1 hypothetical protein SAMN05880561_101608 [Rhizobium sp. RU33A]